MHCAKTVVQQQVEALENDLIELSHYIHDNPEIGLLEYKASDRIISLLEKYGIQVWRGYCGFETAFIATVEGARPGPHVAFLAEYDALPEVGHGCGHNVIATCAVGAFLAACSQRDKFAGRLSLIGTPAEENHSSKRTMLKKGGFDGVDYALMIHPSSEPSKINRTGRASGRMKVRFIGKAAHSSGPQKGINALSAAIELFNGIDRMRPTFLITDNINGIISNGGRAANIIPEEAVCEFSLRSNKKLELEVLVEKVKRIAEASAAMIGAQVEIFVSELGYERYPNLPLSEAFKTNMEALGEQINYADPNKLYGSSDINDVSVFIPIIHDYLCISDHPVNEHSKEFADYAASPRADEICIKGAKGLAMTAMDIFENAELREKIEAYQKANVPEEYHRKG